MEAEIRKNFMQDSLNKMYKYDIMTTIEIFRHMQFNGAFIAYAILGNCL